MDDCWEYNVKKKEWKKIEGKQTSKRKKKKLTFLASGDIPEPRSVHAGAMFSDYVWVFGGEGSPSGSNEIKHSLGFCS